MAKLKRPITYINCFLLILFLITSITLTNLPKANAATEECQLKLIDSSTEQYRSITVTKCK